MGLRPCDTDYDPPPLLWITEETLERMETTRRERLLQLPRKKQNQTCGTCRRFSLLASCLSSTSAAPPPPSSTPISWLTTNTTILLFTTATDTPAPTIATTCNSYPLPSSCPGPSSPAPNHHQHQHHHTRLRCHLQLPAAVRSPLFIIISTNTLLLSPASSTTTYSLPNHHHHHICQKCLLFFPSLYFCSNQIITAAYIKGSGPQTIKVHCEGRPQHSTFAQKHIINVTCQIFFSTVCQLILRSCTNCQSNCLPINL